MNGHFEGAGNCHVRLIFFPEHKKQTEAKAGHDRHKFMYLDETDEGDR